MFTTREPHSSQMQFITEVGLVGKSTLDAWQRHGWIEKTSTKALPDAHRIRTWELTEEGAEALMLEDSQGSEAPQQSDGQSQHSPELSERL